MIKMQTVELEYFFKLNNQTVLFGSIISKGSFTYKILLSKPYMSAANKLYYSGDTIDIFKTSIAFMKRSNYKKKT